MTEVKSPRHSIHSNIARQHSSPIPIQPISPNDSLNDNFKLNPSKPEEKSNQNEAGNEQKPTPSSKPYVLMQYLRKRKNYRDHAFKNMSSAQCLGLIQIGLMIITFYAFTYRAFPAIHSDGTHHDILQLFKNPTKPSLMFNIIYFMTEIIYPIVFILALIFYIILSAKDSGIKLSKEPQNKLIVQGDTGKFWCYLCEEVREKGTKHCYSCCKCVPDFDHHCPFLNTCIGGKNYSIFIVFAALLEILCLLQVCPTIPYPSSFRNVYYCKL